MWLINCETLELEEFVNQDDAKYAILSHTWVKGEEVTHAEFSARDSRGKVGWQKIEETCRIARADGIEYAWVDTCCIDKSSSAELSEAINSMFNWYASSEVCYTYLADYDMSDVDAKMADSRWFTRGWTLQELIAPATVRFFDKSWHPIDTKENLKEQLHLITGIDKEVLLPSTRQPVDEILGQVPIARRMSWAAKRETTRIEDTAYCLLGIFGINFSLLYGEGDRAFIRLQEEIVKGSNDLSILAWRSPENEATVNAYQYCGVFAQHPRDFQASDKLVHIQDLKFAPDFAMTNKGMKIVTRLGYNDAKGFHLIEINCQEGPTGPNLPLGVFLKHQGASVFSRAAPHLFASNTVYNYMSTASKPRDCFLSKTIAPATASSLHKVHRRSFVIPEYYDPDFYLVKVGPEALWDWAQRAFITDGLREFTGYNEYACRENLDPSGGDLVFPHQGGRFFVLFGFAPGESPWATVFWLEDHSKTLPYWIQSGNWTEVARYIKAATGRPDRINLAWTYDRSVRHHLRVRLSENVQDGEVVYSIWLHRISTKDSESRDQPWPS